MPQNKKQADPDFIPADDSPDFIPAEASGDGGYAPMNSPGPGVADTVKNAVTGFAKDLPVGIAKGVGNTVSGVGDLISSVPKVGPKLIPEEGQNAFHSMNVPHGAGENTGYYGEQIGEYFLPTGLEKGAATMFGKAAPKLAKIGTPVVRAGVSALETGVRNKLQGGDFGTGAIAGGTGSAVGQGLEKLAPKIAESALGITKRDRGYGKTIGDAALNEISGVRPSTLAKNASNKTSELTNQLEGLANRHAGTVDIKPAIAVVDGEITKAASQNNATALQHLEKVKQALTQNATNNLPLSPNQGARGALDLKRGLRNQFVKNWNPDLGPEVTRDVAKRASRAIDVELDKNLGPDFRGLNQRVSSLLPVADKAESVDRNAGIAQKIAHRAAAHTGALAGAGIGSTIGYHRGGAEGALLGGIAGMAGPELLTSPTAQMTAARLAKSGAIPTLGKGIALQLDRSDVADPEAKKKAKK